ncbi:MAG: S-layer homology domain-containing protein [Bacillota bacterium]
MLLLLCFLLFPASASAGGNNLFKDVPAGSVYAPYITFLYERGVVKGYPDGTFGSGRGLTRAEAVTALSLASNISPSEAASPIFSDVPSDHWAAGFISSGVKSGILKGYPDGTFRPEDLVTRAELAALLVNLSGMEISPVPANTAGVSAEHWAKKFIDAAVKKDFFLYKEGGGFNPESPATREVFARGAALAVTSSPRLSVVNLKGTIAPLKGKVKLTRSGKETELNKAAVVMPADLIVTGDNAEAEITFEDGTGILVKANTSVKVTRAGGKLSIRKDGKPVSIAYDVEVKLDYGKIVVACSGPAGRKTDKTALISNTTRIASVGQSIRFAAGLAEAQTAGRGTVNVVTPFGTVSGNGFWTNEVTSTGQSTTVLMGETTVEANGKKVLVAAGQAASSGKGGPEAPRQMTAAESAEWNGSRQWVQSQAGKIESVSLVNINSGQGTGQTVQNQQQPGIQEQVNKSIDSLSGTQGAVSANPAAGGGGAGGGGVSPPQEQNKVPSVIYSMDYVPEGADQYKVNIYLDSMANATYIEYTFEYDNTRLNSLGVIPDLMGIVTAFAGHGNLSLSDISIDTGWIISGAKTFRTIKTRQLDTADPLNYNGGRVRLLYLDFKRIAAGSAAVGIKNIKVSYGNTSLNMPDVSISIQ